MKPKFGSGIISDFAKLQEGSNKVEALGVFTQFNAWGYPCNRNWFLTFTVFDIIAHDTILISLKRKGSKEQITLGAIDINTDGTGVSNNQTIHAPLAFSFEKKGEYELICSFKNSTGSLKIPFRVSTLPWPVFSKEERELLEQLRQHIPTKINVNVNCAKCNHVYVFEESVFNDEPASGGTMRFPESGEMECENCGHILKLKDIQGRIRSSLKDNLISLIKRLPNVQSNS